MVEDDGSNRLHDALAATEYVQRTLNSYRAQYERLETRAATIVTTTGGLVTVIGVVTAFIPEDQRFDAFSTPSLVLLVFALVLFMVAVALAQGSNLVQRFADSDRIALNEAAGNTALASAALGSREGFPAWRGHVGAILEAYRRATERKNWYLKWATLSQMGGVITLTGAVILSLLRLLA